VPGAVCFVPGLGSPQLYHGRSRPHSTSREISLLRMKNPPNSMGPGVLPVPFSGSPLRNVCVPGFPSGFGWGPTVFLPFWTVPRRGRQQKNFLPPFPSPQGSPCFIFSSLERGVFFFSNPQFPSFHAVVTRITPRLWDFPFPLSPRSCFFFPPLPTRTYGVTFSLAPHHPSLLPGRRLLGLDLGLPPFSAACALTPWTHVLPLFP